MGPSIINLDILDSIINESESNVHFEYLIGKACRCNKLIDVLNGLSKSFHRGADYEKEAIINELISKWC